MKGLVDCQRILFSVLIAIYLSEAGRHSQIRHSILRNNEINSKNFIQKYKCVPKCKTNVIVIEIFQTCGNKYYRSISI